MSWISAVKTLLMIVAAIKEFLILLKKRDITDAKNNSLEKGDQREFETALSGDDKPPDLIPSDKYSGMYERPTKKKP